MKRMCKFSLCLMISAICFAVSGEIQLVSPVENTIVPLLSENEKKIREYDTPEARKAVIEADSKEKKIFFGKKALWRRPLPVEFKWKCTDGESAPFRITVSEKPDFSDPVYAFIGTYQVKYMKYPSDKLSLPPYYGNFKIGQKYYWKVAGKDRKIYSKVSSFTTENHPPRWIAVEGRVGNIRDLGGWKTTDGYTVRQGHLFCGEGLNDNSVDCILKGRSRLMVEDIALLCGELGIKTDLDLRGQRETAYQTESPMGKGVKFILVPSTSYTSIHGKYGKNSMLRNFRTIADPKNHPVYFHCIGGYDRTGSVAFIANGVLGVSENDLASDWEQSGLPRLPDIPPVDKFRNFDGMVKSFYQYGKPGDSLKVCIEKYLLSCGITAEEIETFRKTMLVK